MIKISPSLLSADFTQIKAAVELVSRCGADYIHCDVMDGGFVPEITFGAKMIRDLRACTDTPLQVHLMINEPQKHVRRFMDAGAYSVTVHVENCPDIQSVLDDIRAGGVRAGVAINPETPAEALDGLDCDEILVMTVHPGYGAQAFIPQAAEKIRILKARLAAEGRTAEIGVDGGVNPQTAPVCVALGADTLISGNYIFTHEDPALAMDILRGVR